MTILLGLHKFKKQNRASILF